MKHLSPEELVAAAEGCTERRDHLVACEACRGEVAGLAAALREAADVTVPEPSPLFWQHFSTRVSDAVREERLPASGRPRWWRLAVPALAALALVVLVGRLDWLAPFTRTPVTARPPSAPVVPSADVEQSAGDEEAWRAFAALAIEADPGDASLSSPGPGAAEGAVDQMSDDEQGELIRLLKAEIARGPRSQG